MNRNKFIEGLKIKRDPAAEVGQLWRWRDPTTHDHLRLMLLHRPYEAGFHCVMAEGHGNISFNGLQNFYGMYEYVKDATPDEISKILADWEIFKNDKPIPPGPLTMNQQAEQDRIIAFAERMVAEGGNTETAARNLIDFARSLNNGAE